MIIAVVAVRMMQVSLDQIIGVIPVRHRFMAAARAMAMSCIMAAAAVVRRAALGIVGAHFHDMLVDVILVRMMQMAVVEIIDVSLMSNRDVPATWSMNMGMIGVNGVIMRSHASFLSRGLVDPFQCDA
jgi:hypothetical protein